MVPLAWWIAATDICQTCTELEVDPGPSDGYELWLGPMLVSLGRTLSTLHWEVKGDVSDIGAWLHRFSDDFANTAQ